jgi:hypothetical protein
MKSFKIYNLFLASQDKKKNYEAIRKYSDSPEKRRNNSVIALLR